MDLSNDVVLDIKKENQEFLQFKKLQKYSDLISHCYSLGIDKNYRTFKANKKPLPEDEYDKNMNDYKLLCEDTNEVSASLEIRSHILYYLKGMPKSKEMKNKICTCKSSKEIFACLDEYEAYLKEKEELE